MSISKACSIGGEALRGCWEGKSACKCHYENYLAHEISWIAVDVTDRSKKRAIGKH